MSSSTKKTILEKKLAFVRFIAEPRSATEIARALGISKDNLTMYVAGLIVDGIMIDCKKGTARRVNERVYMLTTPLSDAEKIIIKNTPDARKEKKLASDRKRKQEIRDAKKKLALLELAKKKERDNYVTRDFASWWGLVSRSEAIDCRLPVAVVSNGSSITKRMGI